MLNTNQNDFVTVSSYLSEVESEDIKEVVLTFISAAPFNSWVDSLLTKSAHRKLENLSDEIPKIVYDEGSIEEKIDRVNSKLMENKITRSFGTPKLAKEISKNIIDELSNPGEKENVIKTNFENVDDKIHGFKQGDLIILLEDLPWVKQPLLSM